MWTIIILLLIIFWAIIDPSILIAPLISFCIIGFIFWLFISKSTLKVKLTSAITVLFIIIFGGYYLWTAPEREYKEYLEEERKRLTEWSTPPPKPQKDSVDYIIEERLTTKFDNTIFAGISFGDNPTTVKQKLREYKHIYGDTIFIPTDSLTKKLVIGRIRQEYYKQKLYKLEICYNTDHIESALTELYTSKYGKTKKRCWEFTNVKISFYSGYNSIARDNKGYKNDPILYYDYIGGGITRDGGYGIIGYEDKITTNKKQIEEEQERKKQDSIKKEKDVVQEKREKELATQQQQQI